MYCRKCGAKFPDGTPECTVCGAQLSVPVSTPVMAQPEMESASGFDAAPQPMEMPDFTGTTVALAEKAKGSKKLPLIIGIVAALAIVAVALVFILGGSGGAGSPEAAVETFLKATFSADVDKLLSVVPDELSKEALEDMDTDEMENYLKEMLEEMEEYGVQYSYEVLESDDVSKRELKELKEYYDDEYDLEISDAAVVEAELTIESEFDDQTQSMEFTVIEIDGSWYIDLESMESIF